MPARTSLPRCRARWAFAVAASVLALGAGAQQAPDVPYVPTPANVVDTMLDMARIGAGDYLIDLGSGDGRIVIEAAKRHGIRAMGVELDGGLVNTANTEARRQGLADRVAFTNANIFVSDIARATVVTMYLFPQINLQLRPRLFADLRPGARVVSHDFDMGEWKADEKRQVAVPGKPYGPPSSMIYLWHIPADLSGGWEWQLALDGGVQRYRANFDQRFQEVNASALVDGGAAIVRDAVLRGTALSFTLERQLDGRIVKQDFSGRIDGDRASGTVQAGGATLDWQATRVQRGKMRTD
jgi:hypothetical protein